MRIFPSRYPAMPRLCLWLVLIASHLAHLHAFTRNLPVSSSSSSSSSHFSSFSHSSSPLFSDIDASSSPRKRYFHFRNYVFKLPLKTSSFTKRLVKRKDLEQHWDDTPVSSDSAITSFKPVFSPFRPIASLSSNEPPIDIIDNDVFPIKPRKNLWSSKFRILRPLTYTRSRLTSNDFKGLRQFNTPADKVKYLKNKLRRRLKESGILKRKALLRSHSLNSLRLNKMARLEGLALAKSESPKIPRTFKSRRAEFFVHRPSFKKIPFHKGIQTVHHSFNSGFGPSLGGEDFLKNEKPLAEVGPATDFHKTASRFLGDHFPEFPDADFIVNDKDGFSSLVPSSSSSMISSLSVSKPRFVKLPKHTGRSFGGFIETHATAEHDFLPPIQNSNGFDFFPLDASAGSNKAIVTVQGKQSPFSDDQHEATAVSDGGDFIGGFKNFEDSDKDCAVIEITVCQTSKDCSCNGLYSCFGSRCIMKQQFNGGGDDPFGGTWHEAPVDEMIGPIGGDLAFIDAVDQ